MVNGCRKAFYIHLNLQIISYTVLLLRRQIYISSENTCETGRRQLIKVTLITPVLLKTRLHLKQAQQQPIMSLWREKKKKSLPEVSTRSDKLISHSQRLILNSDNHDRRFLSQKKELDLPHKSKFSKTIKIQKKHNIPFSPLTEFVIMHFVLCSDKYANVI